MRLASISTRVLDALDLSRAEAREECRGGWLWASSRFDVALAGNEEQAKWALETEAVERVECSTLPEGVIERLGQLAVQRRWALEERRRKPRPGAVVLEGPSGLRLEVAPSEDGGSVDAAVAELLERMPNLRRK